MQHDDCAGTGKRFLHQVLLKVLYVKADLFDRISEKQNMQRNWLKILFSVISLGSLIVTVALIITFLGLRSYMQGNVVTGTRLMRLASPVSFTLSRVTFRAIKPIETWPLFKTLILGKGR